MLGLKGSRLNSAFRASADSMPTQMRPHVLNLAQPLPKQSALNAPVSDLRNNMSLNHKIQNFSDQVQDNGSTYQIILPGPAAG